MPDDTDLRSARGAPSRGSRREAAEASRPAAADGRGSAEEFERLAEAAYRRGDLEGAVAAWEHAHRVYDQRGEAVEAARAAVNVATYLMIDTGLMAPVRGWTARAERLLDGTDETPVHAWLAMVRAYERLMCGDMSQAGHWARQSIEIGTRQGARAPVAVGQMAAARLLIFEGEVQKGLELLDEAAVATVSAELEPLVVGIVYCELICAMQGLAQYDRAAQWTDAMEQWRQAHAFGSFNGRCRVHRAEILRLRGSWDEAEIEAVRACEELRPWMRREFGWPLTELGTIRLRKGDLAGAEEAFLAAHANGWDPNPGLALLRLAQDDVAASSALIRDALEHPSRVPSKERPPYGGLARAPLLDAQVEIAVAGGDLAVAALAADELDQISAAYGSSALTAAARLARGRVALAQGDAKAAVLACDEAVGIWSEVGAPYEVALARVALGRAHQACGNEERAQLELRAAQTAFERVGAPLKAREAVSTGADTDHDARPAQAAEGTASPGVFRRSGDTRTVEFDGRTVLFRDLQGMRYLARLLAEPGREFHVLDLVASEQGSRSTASVGAEDGLVYSYGTGTGPLLDDQAVQAYKRRLLDIEEDLEEAERMGDTERVSLATADRDYLLGELSRAFGLGGQHRVNGAASERARASVTRSVRYALARLGQNSPALAEHLRYTVHTGTYCSYTPDPRAAVTWQV